MNMEDNNSRCCDVLVIGGGPAGSTVSTFLKQAGHDVVLLEKDQHPRFHIGESMLPFSLPIFKRLGVLEKVHSIGVVKKGVDFNYHKSKIGTKWGWFADVGDGVNYAYQVHRAQLDEILINNAAEKGVTVLQRTEATEVTFGDDDTITVVRSRSADGKEVTWRPKFVVDATGRDTLLSGRYLHSKQAHASHRSAAMFAHCAGVPRREGDREGNISMYWFDHGWVWMIPLQGDVMSVGAVCSPEYLKTRGGRKEAFFWETLKLMPDANERMTNATLKSEVTFTGNYSYFSKKMFGNNYLLVGDAYAFLDPVWSSGVLVAMKSAEKSSTLIDRWLKREASATGLFGPYKKWVDNGISQYGWFIFRFRTPFFRGMWMRDVKQTKMVARIDLALATFLSGNVFDYHEGMSGLRYFKTIYYAIYALNRALSAVGIVRLIKAMRDRKAEPAGA